jgi:hypothetical protein
LTQSPDALREAMIEQLTFRKIGTQFDFCVNQQSDATAMPIEDPTVEWTSPPCKLATVSIYPQKFDSSEQMSFVENLTWNPWNSLPAHTPLGGINRARRSLYIDSQQLRHKMKAFNQTCLQGANHSDNNWKKRRSALAGVFNHINNISGFSPRSRAEPTSTANCPCSLLEL